MKQIARPMYSNPPLHGALLVSKILHDKDLKPQWFQVGVAGLVGLGSKNSKQSGSGRSWVMKQIGRQGCKAWCQASGEDGSRLGWWT